MKVEYGFDVDQVAEGNYGPKAHHDLLALKFQNRPRKSIRQNLFAQSVERFFPRSTWPSAARTSAWLAHDG